MVVEFNDESHEQRAAMLYQQMQGDAEAKGLAGWLVKKNLAHSAGGANAIMLTITIISMFLTALIFYEYIRPKPPHSTTADVQALQDSIQASNAK